MLRATSSSTGGRQAVAGRPVGSGLASLAGSTRRPEPPGAPWAGTSAELGLCQGGRVQSSEFIRARGQANRLG